MFNLMKIGRLIRITELGVRVVEKIGEVESDSGGGERGGGEEGEMKNLIVIERKEQILEGFI
jgi:hypothetical protein